MTSSDASRLTTEELLAELARRKQEGRVVLPPPEPLPNPELSYIVALVVDSVNALAEEGPVAEDFHRHIYQRLLEAIYGKAYWEWERLVLANAV